MPAERAAASLPASVPLVTTPRNWPDSKSYADPLSFVTRSFDLDLDVDFGSSQLRGSATLELERVDPSARELVLDTRDLQIDSVRTAPVGSDDFRKARFVLDRRDDELGSALRIAMPRDAARVPYRLCHLAAGLRPAVAAASADGGQAVIRSCSARPRRCMRDRWRRCRTRRIRATYGATLRCPTGCVAVMAAEGDAANRRGQRVPFRMPQPIPSYLLALAVGDLEFRAIGPRTGVWAEPSKVDAAAKEFEDTEAMLTKTEALYGPYRWGRYDVLVLPPFVSVRRHGESAAHLHDADGDRWRQVPGGGARARTRAFLVRQPGDQRDLA